ncbi:unnamed protein product [Rotaria sp. Silwood2]|nr:unnamed protein product [Rotaria sp. Silwood2]CAF4352521.1 unnamed protein product [Rotaria sp. Silwood2]
MDSHRMINESTTSTFAIKNQESFKVEQNNTQKNDKPLSLILSLRINDRFLLQNQTIDEKQCPSNHQSNLEILSTIDDTTSIEDFNRTNKHLINTNNRNQSIISLNNNANKSSLSESSFTTTNDRFQPAQTSSNEIDNKEQSIKITSDCVPSLTLSLTRKPESILNLRDILSSTILETSSINQLTSSSNSNELLQTIPLLISTVLKNHYTSQRIASEISDKPSTALNLTRDEIIMLNNLSEAINKIIQKEFLTNLPLNIEIEDSIPISAKQLEITERRKQRYKLQREIINSAKKVLKPAFKKQDITKQEYKKIMKKVVTKSMYSHKVNHKSIRKMVDAYIKKYQSLHHHHHHSNSLK